MRNDMTDPKLTHFALFEAFSGSSKKGRVLNSTFFKGLAKAGERIRTADVQLGKLRSGKCKVSSDKHLLLGLSELIFCFHTAA